MMIYLASSWRNKFQPDVLKQLRESGHEVYDFRNPYQDWPNEGFDEDDQFSEGGGGFQWSEIEPHWMRWTPWAYTQALKTSAAQRGFANDFEAMQTADTCVLLLPSGRSAHIEAGWFAGVPGKTLHILIPPELGAPVSEFVSPPQDWEPELMYKLADSICLSVEDLLIELDRDLLDRKKAF